MPQQVRRRLRRGGEGADICVGPCSRCNNRWSRLIGDVGDPWDSHDGIVPTDAVFGHFVLDSLVTLFTTMLTFWEGALSDTDSESVLSRVRSNLLLRWDPWEELLMHEIAEEVQAGGRGKKKYVGMGRCDSRPPIHVLLSSLAR